MYGTKNGRRIKHLDAADDQKEKKEFDEVREIGDMGAVTLNRRARGRCVQCTEKS